MQVILAPYKSVLEPTGVIITPLPLSGKSIAWKNLAKLWQVRRIMYQVYVPIVSLHRSEKELRCHNDDTHTHNQDKSAIIAIAVTTKSIRPHLETRLIILTSPPLSLF
jgi:hypothetical protein